MKHLENAHAAAQELEGAGAPELARIVRKIVLDYTQISNVKVEGINRADHPDYVDAFIASADYKNREMTDAELEVLNEDSAYVHAQVEKRLW